MTHAKVVRTINVTRSTPKPQSIPKSKPTPAGIPVSIPKKTVSVPR